MNRSNCAIKGNKYGGGIDGVGVVKEGADDFFKVDDFSGRESFGCVRRRSGELLLWVAARR